jgi:hypothetical protein
MGSDRRGREVAVGRLGEGGGEALGLGEWGGFRPTPPGLSARSTCQPVRPR